MRLRRTKAGMQTNNQVNNNHVIEITAYPAEKRGDHYTIRGRGVRIGHLDLQEGLCVASRATHAPRGESPKLNVRYTSARAAMNTFLRREGWLTSRIL